MFKQSDHTVWSQVKQILGCYTLLLSSLPLSFICIIDIIVLIHANFIEWDINLAHSDIRFRTPQAALGLGRIGHMFMSFEAL
mmetsp:Transcript_8788/g.13566  ORF Transcript_8788/g.13566 Transcript_8788/m.13566 type:complete len:82 (-) Transcript_8788:99-344(-)